MTITFLQPDGVAITAQAERQGSAALYGGGANRRLGGRSGFRVDTPSTILTASSTTWTLTPCSAMIDPGATTHQGMYGWATDANVTGSVTAADATYARKDIVYIKINDSTAGDGSGATTAPVEYRAGTPSASPVAPALQAREFLVGTITVPQSGGGSPTVVLNPARFVAAGGILPVYSSTERDALSMYDGMAVLRMDLAGRPVQVWNGSAWLPNGTERLAVTTADGTWAYNVTLTRTMNDDGTRTVSVGFIVARTGGGAFSAPTGSWTALFAGMIPAGWRPTDNIIVCGGYEFNGIGAVLLRFKTDGGVEAQGVTGSVAMGTPVKVCASAVWSV
jgi:hypothetical protein